MLYAGAAVGTTRLRVTIDNIGGRKEPMWKRRLRNKIKELRKHSSQLEASKDKDISNFRHWGRLERKYSIRVKKLNVVIEELKQTITAIAAKVRRHQGQVDSYRQKTLSENNQKQFSGELDQEEEACDDNQLENTDSFGETYGVSLQIIRRLQSGYKTGEVKLMLKNRI